MEPKVSVVLVNYNGYKDTVDCLKSLSRVDYDNFDVIVVDNASTELPHERRDGLHKIAGAISSGATQSRLFRRKQHRHRTGN